MKNSWMRGLAAAILLLAASPATADDVKSASVILCTSVQAARCWDDGDCEVGLPWSYNIPQFVEIDLTQKVMRTTKASGENRSTPIKNLERADGQLILQGVENGRAFSFVIQEETGDLSVAVALNGITTQIFGACTPITAGQ